jgi:hypothetical protein
VKPARVVIVIALALAACGGGEPDITSTELASIMPSATDAPAGTGIRADASGPRDLEGFVTATDVRRKLRSLGFKVAYTARFASASFPADPSQAPAGSALLGANAIVLRDPDAAHQGFVFYEARLRDRAEDLTPILAENLGTESFAFHFSSLEDSPLSGVAFLFRVGNGLFSLVGVGNPDSIAANPARTLADVIAARAEKA